jgi:hypothetical protein
MGFASFVLKRLQKVKGEFNLVAIAHNLRKIWLHLKVGNKNSMKKPFNYASKDAVKGQ